MIIAVASGKGGTGKTSVAVNIALSIGNVQLIDCDVEEPNSHLLLHPKECKSETVYTLIPKINLDKCTHCGDCARFCQYNALFTFKQEILVFSDLCHSCGGCEIVCPQKAISYEKYPIGTINSTLLDNLILVYGELSIGKPMAVPIIRSLKKMTDSTKTVILDSPPGTSCPFVETIKHSDFCVLVTEPTPFGLHDLKIAVEVLRKIKIPFGIIINRAGIGDEKVYDYCAQQSIPILLEIPYDRKIAELYSKGIPFSLEMPEWPEKFRILYSKIKELVAK